MSCDWRTDCDELAQLHPDDVIPGIGPCAGCGDTFILLAHAHGPGRCVLERCDDCPLAAIDAGGDDESPARHLRLVRGGAS